LKILVIGDSCEDNFIYCSIDRICPEAPVPVLQPVDSTTNPGMAANVARNLMSLGAKVQLITNEKMITKTRFVDIKSGQMIMRFDENDKCDSLNGWLDTKIKYDAIVISDYNKGFLSESDIEQLLDAWDCPTFIDTKKPLSTFAHKATFVKINKPEWENNSNYSEKNVIVTDGKNGATYNGKTYPVNNKVKVSDVSGAGDTFFAGLAYKYIETGDISESINFANFCASKVVQERGVTSI
tara:strand:- start:5021 stop:5737 length:717 start_codon:yes stop_codon:yes gene_type:complete